MIVQMFFGHGDVLDRDHTPSVFKVRDSIDPHPTHGVIVRGLRDTGVSGAGGLRGVELSVHEFDD